MHLDSELNPWLLEVNPNPAMASRKRIRSKILRAVWSMITPGAGPAVRWPKQKWGTGEGGGRGGNEAKGEQAADKDAERAAEVCPLPPARPPAYPPAPCGLRHPGAF